MPPLPADSIHARACKLKCEKILTRPKINQKKAKLNLIIDIIAKIWYYKTKGDDANGLMKHTTKYNFLSKGGSP